MHYVNRVIIVVAMLGGAALGCNKSVEDQQQNAAEAQLEANREITEANRKAEDEAAQARKEMAEKTAEARNEYDKAVVEGKQDINEANEEARKKAAEAQANANETIRSANREIHAANADLREWGQKKVDALNDKMDDTRAKAQTAKPEVRAEVEAGLTDVEQKRDAIISDFAAVDTRTEQAVDNFKERVDTKLDGLKNRVDTLAKRL